ncbi:mitochondrial ribosomal protein L37-domain-containing protein [Cubamyces menziesii]|nr:mitochondrial ribosomal protein L37-domain-containing protein [Cubamyces menziesii]
MSFVRAVRHQLRLTTFWAPRRCLATQSAPAAAAAKPQSTSASTNPAEPPLAKSSCGENTTLVGLNYLKGQPEVMAMPDDAYPSWLWTLLEPKQLPDDGPGGKAEKVRLRKANRQRIRESNFMKTQ